MKKSFLIILTIFFPLLIFSQEALEQKELGIRFYNFDNFGVTYKFGTQKSMWRLNALYASGRYSNSEILRDTLNPSYKSSYNNLSIGFNLGKELRKSIGKNFELRAGADISLNFETFSREFNSISTNYSEEESSTDIYLYPGINLVLGINYLIGNKFLIGIDYSPYLSYRFGILTRDENVDDQGLLYSASGDGNASKIRYKISDNTFLFTIAYRFSRNESQ